MLQSSNTAKPETFPLPSANRSSRNRSKIWRRSELRPVSEVFEVELDGETGAIHFDVSQQNKLNSAENNRAPPAVLLRNSYQSDGGSSSTTTDLGFCSSPPSSPHPFSSSQQPNFWKRQSLKTEFPRRSTNDDDKVIKANLIWYKISYRKLSCQQNSDPECSGNSNSLRRHSTKPRPRSADYAISGGSKIPLAPWVDPDLIAQISRKSSACRQTSLETHADEKTTSQHQLDGYGCDGKLSKLHTYVNTGETVTIAGGADKMMSKPDGRVFFRSQRLGSEDSACYSSGISRGSGSDPLLQSSGSTPPSQPELLGLRAISSESTNSTGSTNSSGFDSGDNVTTGTSGRFSTTKSSAPVTVKFRDGNLSPRQQSRSHLPITPALLRSSGGVEHLYPLVLGSSPPADTNELTSPTSKLHTRRLQDGTVVLCDVSPAVSRKTSRDSRV